jgi:uncharacterized protein (TIGR03067 family)
MKRCLVCVLLALLLGSDSPKEYDDATAKGDRLEGSWLLVGYETGGEFQQMPEGLVMTFEGGKAAWWPHTGGGPNLVMATYRTDPGIWPARLDRVDTGGFHKGKTWKMIYQIDGDTLRIAYRMSGVERPTGFHGNDLEIEIYKRVRK